MSKGAFIIYGNQGAAEESEGGAHIWDEHFEGGQIWVHAVWEFLCPSW